jgi:hypothetical protein
MNDIDIEKLKKMLEELRPKKEEVLDRNKQLFDLLAARINEAYSQGYEDGFNERQEFRRSGVPLGENVKWLTPPPALCDCGAGCCRY